MANIDYAAAMQRAVNNKSIKPGVITPIEQLKTKMLGGAPGSTQELKSQVMNAPIKPSIVTPIQQFKTQMTYGSPGSTQAIKEQVRPNTAINPVNPVVNKPITPVVNKPINPVIPPVVNPLQDITSKQQGNLGTLNSTLRTNLDTANKNQIDAVSMAGQGIIDALNRQKPVLEQQRTEGLRTAENQFDTATNDYGLARERSRALGGGMSEYLQGNAYSTKVNALGENEQAFNKNMLDLGYKVSDAELANNVKLANLRADQAGKQMDLSQDMYGKQDNLYNNAFNREYQQGRDKTADTQFDKNFDQQGNQFDKTFGEGKRQFDANQQMQKDSMEMDDRQFMLTYNMNKDQAKTQIDQFNRTFEYSAGRDKVADNQWRRGFEEDNNRFDKTFGYQEGRDVIGDQRYDKEYADSRGDVNYNRDYQTGRDAVGDSQWDKQFTQNQTNADRGYGLDKAGVTGYFNPYEGKVIPADVATQMSQYSGNYAEAIGRLKAANPNDPLIPYLEQARVEKIFNDPALLAKYGGGFKTADQRQTDTDNTYRDKVFGEDKRQFDTDIKYREGRDKVGDSQWSQGFNYNKEQDAMNRATKSSAIETPTLSPAMLNSIDGAVYDTVEEVDPLTKLKTNKKVINTGKATNMIGYLLNSGQIDEAGAESLLNAYNIKPAPNFSTDGTLFGFGR